MPEITQPLDDLLEHLDQKIQQTPHKDAIDEILGAAPRTSKVRSLRDHEVMQRFRGELANGLIQVDTVHRLLDLVGTVLKTFL